MSETKIVFHTPNVRDLTEGGAEQLLRQMEREWRNVGSGGRRTAKKPAADTKQPDTQGGHRCTGHARKPHVLQVGICAGFGAVLGIVVLARHVLRHRRWIEARRA